MAWTERYVRADAAGSGDGTTDTNSGANGAWTLAEAIAAAAAGQRLNVRGNVGTYANTTTSRTFIGTGTATSQIWWRGFFATAGDLDADVTNTLALPLITWTTGACTFNAPYGLFTNLSFSSARTGANPSFTTSTGSPVRFVGCRFETTGTNTTSVFSNGNAVTHGFLRCSFIGNSTVNAVLLANAGTGGSIIDGCWFEGGTATGQHILTGNSNCFIRRTVCWDPGDAGITIGGTGTVCVDGCTIYSANADGIEITAIPNVGSWICNNLIANSGAWGINNTVSASVTGILRYNNDFYSNNSGNETGFGDFPSIYEQTESSSPFTAAASRDVSLAATANARATGTPVKFPSITVTSYLDIGAVQIQAGSGYLLVAN